MKRRPVTYEQLAQSLGITSVKEMIEMLDVLFSITDGQQAHDLIDWAGCEEEDAEALVEYRNKFSARFWE